MCIHVKSAKFLTCTTHALISLQLSCIIGFIPYTHFVDLKHCTCHIFIYYNIHIRTYVYVSEPEKPSMYVHYAILRNTILNIQLI